MELSPQMEERTIEVDGVLERRHSFIVPVAHPPELVRWLGRTHRVRVGKRLEAVQRHVADEGLELRQPDCDIRLCRAFFGKLKPEEPVRCERDQIRPFADRRELGAPEQFLVPAASYAWIRSVAPSIVT